MRKTRISCFFTQSLNNQTRYSISFIAAPFNIYIFTTYVRQIWIPELLERFNSYRHISSDIWKYFFRDKLSIIVLDFPLLFKNLKLLRLGHFIFVWFWSNYVSTFRTSFFNNNFLGLFRCHFLIFELLIFWNVYLLFLFLTRYVVIDI